MALFNFQNDVDAVKAQSLINDFIRLGKTVEIIQKKNTRSLKQNSALHLLFTIISSQLNEMGVEFKYFGLKGKVLSVRHTPNLVKEHVWRPLQIALFDIQSTKKINTQQINEIVDVLSKYFAEKGVVIQFPSKEQIESLIK